MGVGNFSAMIPGTYSVVPRAFRTATCLVALLLGTGCVPWVGPVEVRLETGGVPQGDFVVHPAKMHGMVHSSRAEWLAPQVAASETDITIPRSWAGMTFSSFHVYVFHPEYVRTFTGLSSSGRLVLPPVVLESWTSRLDSGGVSARMARMHLQQLRVNWLPAFRPGPERARLRRYLPGLEQLLARVTLAPEDLGLWPTIEAARADLAADLLALAAEMQ
jgi:hypothetical protein